MAVVAQLVRALVCGTKSRGFESRRSPNLFLTNPCILSIHCTILKFVVSSDNGKEKIKKTEQSQREPPPT